MSGILSLISHDLRFVKPSDEYDSPHFWGSYEPPRLFYLQVTPLVRNFVTHFSTPYYGRESFHSFLGGRESRQSRSPVLNISFSLFQQNKTSKMCWRDADCTSCGGAKWAGCGRHIEAALAGVPADKRCKCQAGASSDVQGNCPACGEAFKASNERLLNEVFRAHIGLSPSCDPRRR